MLNYIIAGEGRMGLAVKSEMHHEEMAGHIRRHSHKLHPKGHDTVFCIGVLEIVNPRVMSPNDYANYCPYII